MLKKKQTVKNSWDMVILRLYSSLTSIFTLMESFSYIFGRPHLWVWSLIFMRYKHSYIAAKSLQSCPTLCDPTEGSSPGSAVPEILQGRTLEWVAISFSNAWKWKVKVKSLSHVRPSAIPWTAAYQAPLSTGFYRQEYWSGLPLPSPTLTLHI